MANLAIISELIEERKLSFNDFCEQVQVSPQSMRVIIKRNSTKTDILERIAKVLHVPVGYFFNENSNIAITGSQVHTGVGDQFMLSQEKEIVHLKSLVEVQSKLIEEKEQRIQDKDALIKILSDQLENLKNAE